MLSLPARNGGRVQLQLFWLEAPLLRIPSVRQIQITPGLSTLHVRVMLSRGAFTGDVVQAVTRVLRRELHLAEAVIDRLCVQAVRIAPAIGQASRVIPCGSPHSSLPANTGVM
jgi:hypothetical protein